MPIISQQMYHYARGGEVSIRKNTYQKRSFVKTFPIMHLL